MLLLYYWPLFFLHCFQAQIEPSNVRTICSTLLLLGVRVSLFCLPRVFRLTLSIRHNNSRLLKWMEQETRVEEKKNGARKKDTLVPDTNT